MKGALQGPHNITDTKDKASKMVYVPPPYTLTLPLPILGGEVSTTTGGS